MTPRFLTLAIAAVIAIAACSPAPPAKHVQTDPMDTPPATTDPGATMDTPTLPLPAPAAGGSGEAIAPPASGKVAGSACLLATECTSGVCEGPGCDNDHPGRCADERRRCTRDRREYCACDGKAFFGSGSCPERRYASLGKCPP